MNVNQVSLAGRLTRDPEIKHTQSGITICDLSVAVNRRYTSKGEQKEEVTFVDVTFFDKRAEVIGKYFQRGNPIYLTGRLRMEKWQNGAGETRTKMSVVGDDFQFVESRAASAESANQAPYSSPPQQSRQPQRAPAFAEADLDDNIPF